MSDIKDKLAEINGIKPKQFLRDGEQIEFSSDKNKTYKIKRNGDAITCSCPGFRFLKSPIDQKSCKHLRAVLGDTYEEARIQANVKTQAHSSPEESESKGTKVPTSRGVSVLKPKSSGKRKRGNYDDGDKSLQAGEDNAKPSGSNANAAANPTDPLAVINGISPKSVLTDGEEKEISSHTSSSIYRVKRTGDHYYCTCPAWRMQSNAPVNARSCKHLKSFLGDDYEKARIEMMNPGKSTTISGSGGKPKAPNPNKKAKVTKAPELLLANKWDLESGPDPSGWWASEKLDGVRAYFDGRSFLSRLGNPFDVPQNLIDLLPKDVKLDGELFGGRSKFNETVSIVRSAQSKKWSEGVITYQVFDIISMDKDTHFEDRIGKLKELFGPDGSYMSDFVVLVEHTITQSRDHLLDMLRDVEKLGGEGLMIRKPGSVYEGRRSSTLLKIKTFYDAEAEVIGYEPGKGRHIGSTGALKCKMASGKTFRVGTGLSDAQRRKPPKIGVIITYRFQELTPDGVPRFPSYIGEAIDKTEAKDADVRSIIEEEKEKDDA